MSEQKIRNPRYDALKGIACIAVLFMHCEFPGIFGTIVQCITRWSVPLFFTISGVFFKRDTVSECFRKARHILDLILIGTLFYLFFAITEQLCIGGVSQLVSYAKQELTFINIAAWAVLNRPVFIRSHLWFLFALLYVYIAYAIMIKLGLTKYSKPLAVVLLSCHFILGYGSYLAGHPLSGCLFRNFLFEGLPFFLIGKTFKGFSGMKNDNSRKLGGVLLIVCGIPLSIIERFLIGQDFSVHIASLIVIFGELMWAQTPSEGDRLCDGLAYIGKNCSLYVYIFHVAIYRSLDHLYRYLNIDSNAAIQWLRPIIALIFSLMLAIVIYKITDKLCKRRNKYDRVKYTDTDN